MTPSATAVTRRLAGAALTGAVLVPVGGLFAVPAYADDAVTSSSASATPTVDIGEPVYAEVPEAPPATDSAEVPADWPTSGGWIIGGTLQEGSQVAGPPKAAPAAVPAAPAVTVTAPVAPRPAAVGAATALPFTGPGRLSVQLTLGGGLVLLGVALTSAAGRKGTMRHAR